MKKPVAVYAALVLLLLQLAVVTRLAIRSPDPNGYLLGGYRAVVAGALFTALFFWRPRIGRWYVVPYLSFLALGVFRGFAEVEGLSWQLFFNLGVAAFYAWVAVMLCRLPRDGAMHKSLADPNTAK